MSRAVTREQVLAIARLARLRLTDEEATLFTGQLESILQHMEELESAGDAGQVEAHVEDAAPLREDAPSAEPLQFPPSRLSAFWKDGFFTVPRLSAMQDPAEDEPES